MRLLIIVLSFLFVATAIAQEPKPITADQRISLHIGILTIQNARLAEQIEALSEEVKKLKAENADLKKPKEEPKK